MWNSAVEEPPHKKKKMSPPPSSSLSSLPDEIVLNCLARVLRSDQPALARVSKSCRSLVASHEVYKMRWQYGLAENCLYVCLLTPPDENPRWFILCRGLLSPIPSHAQASEASSVVVVDWGIYVIGGLIKGKRTSDVLLLDCRTHKWRKVPSMRLSRSSAAAGVVGGKIYVFGGCEKPDRDSSNWAEVFDPKTQTWEPLPPMPDRKTRCQTIHTSVVVREEKVYAVDLMERSYYYSPSEGIWGKGNVAQLLGNRRDWCVIDRLIYSCDRYGNLCWSEIEQLEKVGQGQGPEGIMCWNKVQGLDSSLPTTLSCSRLVHFDQLLESGWESRKRRFGTQKKIIELLPGARLRNSGANNIVLFWDVINGDHLQIWCAEISLERRQGGAEVWGNMEWSHLVMTVDPFLHHYKL